MSGLRDHLLHPDLIAEFVAEYQREYNRLMRGEQAARADAVREHAQVTRKIDQMVEAICDGFYNPSMKEKMATLEARKAELDAQLQLNTETPLRLHPGLSAVYRAKVADLTAALNEPGVRMEATELLRGLLTEIRLIPEDDGLAIELVGALASIMALGDVGQQKARAFGTGGSQITVVAGARFQKYCTLHQADEVAPP
ncbi:hypothetical protein GALL_496870 [mine drainage metagenome]|uniref:Uncharacterized protein n=1 Tax=mine drainage metagenome TaxID=410659 RepID=A0A1J5PBL7_9ZZZZ